MKLQLLFTALLLFVANHEIKAAEIQPRRAPNCALLANKIYCFGGYILGSAENGVFNSLDIYKNNNGPVQNLNSQWDTVTPNNPSNIAIGRREFPQAAALPDGVSYFIQGGYNYISTVNPQQSIIYNAKTNTLQTAANYVDSNNGGIRQIYYGTGVYLPNLNGVGLYGGYQQHVTLGSNYITPEGATLSGLTFNNTDGYGNSYVGYYYFTLYNLQSNSFSVPAQFNVPKDYHISQSVFFHTKSNKVFYIGGSFYNTTANQVYNSYLTYAMTYNTANGQWLYENIGGNAPSVRKLHTTTLLANGDDVLLYGGTETGTEAVMDYCYTLNIPLMTWSYRNLVAPVGTSGPRSHHAAVLVNQTSLFIMFGIDRSGNPTNDLMVLDVRNANNISFATQFPFDNVGGSSNNNNNNTNNGNNNNGNNNNNQNNNSSNSLGTGAIAGIAVGGIAAGAIAVLAAVCFFRRRRNNNNGGHHTSGTSASYAPQKNNESDLMEVDWDKIDDQYREVNLPPQHQISQANIGKDQNQLNDYYTSSSIGPTGNSLTSSPSNANASLGLAGTNSVMSSPSYANASVARTDTVRSTAISPDFSISSQFKPDSAIYDYPPPQTPLSPTETAFTPPTVVSDGAPPIMMKSVKPDINGH